jgi:predicted aspartyl protease
MMMTIGRIANGSALIKVNLAGNGSDQPVEFEAVFDIGFTGFVYMPIGQARSIGLKAAGTTLITLADGKTQPREWADVWAVVNGRKRQDIAILEPDASADLLIGMDFLRAFQIGVFLTSATFALVDEDAFAQFLSAEQPSNDEAPT